MRRFRSSGVLQPAGFSGDEAEHDHLALRHEPQRLEAAGPLVVVLEEETVHVELAEQGLGDEVVAALGGPGGAEVAAAHVRGHLQVRGPSGDRVVDLADVAQVQVLGVLAAPGDLSPLGRVVEVGQAGVIQLQVGAAEPGQALHLIVVRGGQVSPELLHVRVHVVVDRGGTAAVMDHVRRRDGELGRRGAHLRLQVAEIVLEDRPAQVDLAADVQRGRRPLDLALGVAEVNRQVAGRLADPAQLVDEVHVPGGAPELAVGGGLEADV